MPFNHTYITIPFLSIFVIAMFYGFLGEKPIYCYMVCMQPEISCLATVSYTFGLVPATTLAASSALSGCLSSFDLCELSCAKRSNIQPYSIHGNISKTCEIIRNNTKIQPDDIRTYPYITNPFNLDADCRPRPIPSTNLPPVDSSTPQNGSNTIKNESTTSTTTSIIAGTFLAPKQQIPKS